LKGASNIPVACDLVKEHEYEILDYSVPGPSENDTQASPIIEEYGVFYNLIQMPAGFEVPTKLKTFAAENGIHGVVIIPDREAGPEGVIAGLIRTVEKKIVLVVTQNIIRHPEVIVKTLMGITDAQEVQGRELRSIVKVGKDEKGWKARFARSIEKGIGKATGGEIGSSIDFNKVTIEESGSFSEMFGEEKMTLTIKGRGPYEIGIKKMENVISSVKNITAQLVLEILFKDAKVPYPEGLYIGDDGGMYSCRF